MIILIVCPVLKIVAHQMMYLQENRDTIIEMAT